MRTCVCLSRAQVVDFKYPELHGYWALVLGLGYKPQRYLHPGEIGYFLKQVRPGQKNSTVSVALAASTQMRLYTGCLRGRVCVVCASMWSVSLPSQGVPFKAFLSEFPVSEDCLLPVGTSITAAHYVPGMSVDVVGWTKNKGFQGMYSSRA